MAHGPRGGAGPSARRLFAVLAVALVAGAPACRANVRAQRPAAADRDGDGIPDDTDLCPDTPEDRDGFEDWDGCPEPEGGGVTWRYGGFDASEGDPDAAPLTDTDHDGIPDVKDACPTEPEDLDGFEDTDGCPDPDNDHDGILDADDRCPNEPETYNGFEDDDGCPDAKDRGPTTPAPEWRVTFREGSAAISSDDAQILDWWASFISSGRGVRFVMLRGRADPHERHPRELAAARAEAVRRYFVKHGAPARLLHTDSASFSAPAPGCYGGDCLRVTRRVDLEIEIAR
jgi:outer membrane protein OmpA-like peptidoglycan-associated protein